MSRGLSSPISVGGTPKYSAFTPSDAPQRTQVSFSEVEEREHDYSGRRSNEMNALRSIQTARAVVSSERQKLLARTQVMTDRPLSERSPIGEAEKRASEEQLFEEVALLMQERDLLLREKSALQAILASSAEEIRRLFEAEQRHVVEMKTWLQQKEVLEADREGALVQLDQLKADLDSLRKVEAQHLADKEALQRDKMSVQKDLDDLREKISSSQHEVGLRRAAESAHHEEREEWMSQQESYVRQLAESEVKVKAQSGMIEQLKADVAKIKQERERWEEERREFLQDRSELSKIKVEVEIHKEEAKRWTAVHEQLLKERSDAHSQLQLGLQQMDQQQKTIELHSSEKAQWLKQQETASQARAAVEARNKALEEELAKTRQGNTEYIKERDDLSSKYARCEMELAEGAKHLAAARADYEKVYHMKSHLQEELGAATKELDVTKQELAEAQSQLREVRAELSRVAEYETLYAQEREEKLMVESRLGQKLSESQEALRGSQAEGRQLQELVDMLKSEVQHLGLERQGLVDERTRLQHRLRLTLQELEHLRSNEKRYESESADWLNTHSTLLERVLRHGRDRD